MQNSKQTIYSCSHIGVSGTTKCYVKYSDGQYEARVGIAIMGNTNLPIEELEDMNPFDDTFYDNYAVGLGNSKAEAIENMKVNMDEIAGSLW
jgi:hypothetical protein